MLKKKRLSQNRRHFIPDELERSVKRIENVLSCKSILAGNADFRFL